LLRKKEQMGEVRHLTDRIKKSRSTL